MIIKPKLNSTNHFSLLLLILLSPCFLAAQTYSTSSQGSNNSAGKAYVAPVVTKTYNMSSPGYKAPATVSYNNYKYKEPVVAGNGQGSASAFQDRDALGARTNPGIYQENGKYGISGMMGHRNTNPVYDVIEVLNWKKRGSYYSGLFMISAGGKWGVHYSENKTSLLPVKYDDMRKIDDYTVWVKLNDKVGFINCSVETYKEVIPVEFDEIGSLDESYATYIWLRKGDKFGIVNMIYQPVLPVEFQDIRLFSEGVFLVKKNDRFGLLNRKGNVVLPIEYESISAIDRQVAWVVQKGKWGLIDQSGRLLSLPQYDSVFEQKNGEVWVDNKAVVSKGEKKIYLRSSGVEILLDALSGIELVSPRLKSMDEHFDAVGANTWLPAINVNATIKDGHYVLISKNTGFYLNKLPLPETVKFEEGENWMIEMSFMQVSGEQPLQQGILIENINDPKEKGSVTAHVAMGKGKLHCSVIIKYPGVPFTVENVKAKEGLNSLKVIRENAEISFFVNDKLIKKSGYDRDKIKSGKFLLTADEPSLTTDEGVLYFDDVIFKIL